MNKLPLPNTSYLLALTLSLLLGACADASTQGAEPSATAEDVSVSGGDADTLVERSGANDTAVRHTESADIGPVNSRMDSSGDSLTEASDTTERGIDDASEELPPCLAEAVGRATLHAPATGVQLLDYTEAVLVEATHLEPGGCLTSLTFTWSRSGGCGLTLSFTPGADGIWQLQQATLAPGDACGAGGTGTGNATLSEVPEVTASSPPPHRCTVLWGPILAHGVVELSSPDRSAPALSLHLETLGVDGMLLSEAVNTGTCGASYTPCVQQECGLDPLLDTQCGVCGDSAICDEGGCQEVDPVVAVCQRVLDDRADLGEDTWSGSTASCDPAAMSSDWQERALRLTNLYRWLAGQPPLTLSTAGNPAMQSCALMMHAAQSLSHSPSEAWPCYSEDGASAAGTSNLAPVPAVEAIDLYMADPGNATTIGHRRWILSDWISTTAFGSTDDSSCMHVVQGFGGPTPWIAWPPPGFYPMEMHNVAYQTVDQTGWTIQTNNLSLSGAQAEVREDGVTKAVDAAVLLPNYGSQGALKITPQGWTIQAGSEYEVSVNTNSQTIAYSFLAVDCQALLTP